MALKRMVMELGMGTDIRGEDYTKAACRAVHNALRQNSLSVADAFGVSRDDMQIEVLIGAAQPDTVDKAAVADMFPYGKVDVTLHEGGMDTVRDNGGRTIMVNAAVLVNLDLPEGKTWEAKA